MSEETCDNIVSGNLFPVLTNTSIIAKSRPEAGFLFPFMYRYFIIYKPYKVLSQFSKAEGKLSLADFFKVPADVYPVGRLDEDSEGLLILTNDKKLNHHVLNPSFAHEREYYVQVEGKINEDAVMQLQQGIEINIDNIYYKTKPCRVSVFETPPTVPERNPPIRFRANIPDTWISMILTEGKNRQVRKMGAKIGFPVLRLIRNRIEKIKIANMQPGDIIELSKPVIYKKLFHGKIL